MSAQSWSGVVAFVRVYNRALTAEEVYTNYSSLDLRDAWGIRAGDDVVVVLQEDSQSGQLEATVNLTAEWGPEIADSDRDANSVIWSFLSTPQPANFSSNGLSLTATFTQVGRYIAQVEYKDDHKEWLTVLVNSDPQVSLLQASTSYTLLAQDSEERGRVGVPGSLSFVLPEPILASSGDGTRPNEIGRAHV